ncbi:MAG: N-acetyltransferase [Phototrophicales bacterium]|nr:MAG: N-acetyltransferase [Phototrophicales bacterium]
MSTKVHNNIAEKRYELTLEDGQKAILDYRLEGQRIIFTHAEVPPQWEGRGIGSQLVKMALDDARQQGLQVQALCSFVRAYIARHPEYHDIAIGFGAKSTE